MAVYLGSKSIPAVVEDILKNVRDRTVSRELELAAAILQTICEHVHISTNALMMSFFFPWSVDCPFVPLIASDMVTFVIYLIKGSNIEI